MVLSATSPPYPSSNRPDACPRCRTIAAGAARVSVDDGGYDASVAAMTDAHAASRNSPTPSSSPGGGAVSAEAEVANHAAIVSVLDSLKNDPERLGGKGNDPAREQAMERAKALVPDLGQIETIARVRRAIAGDPRSIRGGKRRCLRRVLHHLRRDAVRERAESGQSLLAVTTIRAAPARVRSSSSGAHVPPVQSASIAHGRRCRRRRYSVRRCRENGSAGSGRRSARRSRARPSRRRRRTPRRARRARTRRRRAAARSCCNRRPP